MEERRRCPWSFRFGLILAVWLLLAAPVWGEVLTIPGTGACETLVCDLAEAFNRVNPEDQVAVPGSTGSGGGIRAVLAGEAWLVRVARRLKVEEERQGLRSLFFARDVVVFVVGRQVKVASLTPAQLASIFSGKTDDWRDVGGHKGRIRVVTREPGDATLTIIKEQLPEFRDLVFAPEAKVILYDRMAVETLDKYKNAVGFLTTSSVKWSKGGFAPIALEGIAPTRANVLAGRYRLFEDFSFVYKNDLKPAARKFVDFVFSPQGRRVIEANGLIALDRR